MLFLPTKKTNTNNYKFIQRSLRNEIFNKISSLAKTGISITESLTKRRLWLLKLAQNKFGFKSCWALKGKIYCAVNKKKYCHNNTTHY